MEQAKRYYDAITLLPPFVNVLQAVPRQIAENACEVRVRAGRPITVETPAERHICAGVKATMVDIGKCISYFCDYSLYSCEKELSEGWITLRGGHRAGFTGTAVMRADKMTTIKDISSIDLRIASERKGSAEKLLSLTALEKDFRGLLILGAPMSGKTTVLRDYARLLASFARVAVIDERGELAAVYNGIPQNDIGLNSDILDRFPKETGIMQALRSLSPEYIVCDEVGPEYERLSECAGRGVKLILTAHCGSMSEAADNRAVRYLTDCGAVNYTALLMSGENTGKPAGLWRTEKSEDIGGCGCGSDLYRCRSRVLGGA
ncbi:MAG: hypothetical protein K5876_00155 [Ruminiclostridium sp.]|nr:hypothetical protein [Ruminiclostridium sp.]